MKTTLLIILLSVSGLQIVSTGKEPKCVDFNTYNKEHGSRSLNIVKEEDGYFYYLYDRSCWDLNTINVLSPDERFFLKVFMGNTYDDVLASIDQIENWYKNVEEKE